VERKGGEEGTHTRKDGGILLMNIEVIEMPSF